VYASSGSSRGSLWIALFGTNQLARVSPGDGALKLYPLPDAGARPRRIAVDGDGMVWYTDYARGRLGVLDPATGRVRDFASPGGAGSGPYGIAIAPDGRVWYDESGTGTIVSFDRRTQQTEVVKIPTAGAIVRNMAVDTAHGRLWLALSGTQRLGRVDLR
jgi:virginiamycin B lyase